MPLKLFVTGGVMSGLGKGVVAASVAKLLQLSGLNVSCMKLDPYINCDAGLMGPGEHGEVFVTADGGECDMDIGTYERFLGTDIPKSHNLTTGQAYRDVIARERDGGYLGKCVQIIPHVTDEIRRRMDDACSGLDALVVECGGTVGDIESLPFLEAMRQAGALEPARTAFIHVTLAPSLDVVGEQKTKPTQHSVQELRRIGIRPDYLVVRCSKPLLGRTREKIAMFTGVPERDVLSCHDADSILDVPRILHEQGVVDSMFRRFGMVGLVDSSERWDAWNRTVGSITKRHNGTARIAMVGKYVDMADSYASVRHAMSHAAAALGASLSIDPVDADGVYRDTDFSAYDGVLVPGGFGARGADGIMRAAGAARDADIPYLGICLGFQLAAVSFARDLCGMVDADTAERSPDSTCPVVHLLPGQDGGTAGGSLRLGAHDIDVKPGTVAYEMYGNCMMRRHRHRYEINRDMIPKLTSNGMVFSAHGDGGRRMEILEVPCCRFYVGVQFHPEFSSRPGAPEPAFLGFVKAARERAGQRGA